MKIKVGNVVIGGDKIPIQTMIKNSIKEEKKTLNKIENLHSIGCDILRVAVPEISVIPNLKNIVKNSPIPIVADIHFDHILAIRSIESGVHKIRINPGNINDENKVNEIIKCLKEYKIPVRIGINGGSLPEDLIKKYKDDKKTIMIESAKRELKYFEKYGYDKIVLSFKCTDVKETIEVNKNAKKVFGLPLHIGITEAGDLIDGTVKNSIGIALLLRDGIGDTIRVSLTDSEEKEIIVGKRILESIGKREAKCEIISCPTCGRTTANISKIVNELKKNINEQRLKNKIKIAVMGCVVNGPGEAMSADFGVACGKDRSVIFQNGTKQKVIKNSSILDELLIMVSGYYEK